MGGFAFCRTHVLLLIIGFVYIEATLVHRKFEYKYSFKPPYLAQKDGSVPFWEYGGNAIASAENVRIAPSLRSQKGAIWTKNPINFENWDVDISFRVTGRGRIGADGLAFWYTQNKGDYDGNVFGSSDKWVGLGLFFDSFDNDNKHNNPYIMAIVNDGTKEFDHAQDGSTQQLAGCLRDFRNKPFATRARIEYHENTLTVLFHNGMTGGEQDYEVCLRAENVALPSGGHFGVSAATGGLADDHDVNHLLAWSLHRPGQAPAAAGAAGGDEQQQRLQQEYQEYQRKLDQQKADYRKEHPDEKEPEMEDWFESDNQRELRQIFQGQNQIYEIAKELGKKLDEVVGRQERTMGLIAQGAGAVAAPPPPPGQAPPPAADAISRREVDAVLDNQKQMLGAAREIRQAVSELKARADAILSNQAKAPTAQVQAMGYDSQALVAELRDGLNQVKQGTAQIAQKMDQQPAGGACPAPSCVSLTTMLMVVAAQLVIILGYSFYRESRESQAKKFY